MNQFVLHAYKAFKNSCNGLNNAIRSEWAFKIEVVFFLIAIPCAFYLGKNAIEYVLLLGSFLWLLVIELLNSAIETTVDRIGLDHHQLSGLAKDLASAAVLLAILNLLITWGIILFYNLK